jgi:hypothetical protein
MSVGFFVLVFTSIVDTAPLPALLTKTVLPSGVTATPFTYVPTVMSVGFLVFVFKSIVDTVPLVLSATKAVLPSRRERHPEREHADGDVGGVLGSGLHINRRHRVAEGVGDQGRRPTPRACRHRRRPGRDHTHQRAREPEHQHPKRPPERPHPRLPPCCPH